MKKRVIIEKQIGETPLAAIRKWKEANPEYKNIPASYAGRLDPMASGKLLVLLGEECKKQKEYTKLDKEYEIEVLFDVGSDTGDALGLVELSSFSSSVDNISRISEILKREVGSHTRPYPAFSSKTVCGKPLFLYALEGTLHTIEIPTHEEKIYEIQNLSTTSPLDSIATSLLRMKIDAFLAKVPRSNEPSKALGADFRANAVTQSWKALFNAAGERLFTVVKLRVVCGPGVYMRSLAPRLGEALGTHAIALSIHRSKIGV